MSRKSRKKFKKMLRAQMATQRVAAPSGEQIREPAQVAPDEPTSVQSAPVAQNVAPRSEPVPTAASPVSEDTVAVKHEIRKTLLTILILVALIVAIYFVNLKTDFILKIGEFLSQNLNINV